MNDKKRIGIMGGTFDPVHLGHLIIAETARIKLNLDEVIFMPVGEPPHKAIQSVSSAAHRLAMVKLSIEGNTYFSSSDMEVLRQGETYTIDTLMELSKQEEREMFFITGADAMDSIATWKDYEKLFDYASFVVVSRNSDLRYTLKPEHQPFREHIIILDTPFIEISSTQVRHNVREDISIRYIVRDSVRDYIYENRLYLDRTN